MLGSILSAFERQRTIGNASEIIEYYRQPRPIEDLVELTLFLSQSENVFTPNELAVDIPSTGGPSSLSTLLCPLYLCTKGFQVRKIGVPGRPAGGIDVLAQIPNYRTSYSINELMEVRSCFPQYLHFEAAEGFAPLDGILFGFRKQLNAINVPQLAISSLLAKKIAVGVKKVNLDIRMAPFGNFGKNIIECRHNAYVFSKVAEKVGICARSTINDASIPYQPYIGRQEALHAVLELLEGEASPWLRDHNHFCIDLCNALLSKKKRISRDDVNSAIIHEARKVFQNNLSDQGSSYEDFYKKAKELGAIATETIYAQSEGYIRYHLDAIRTSVVNVQTQVDINENNRFSDPLGVKLLVEPGAKVFIGDAIATIRIRSEHISVPNYNNWFSIESQKTPSIYDRIIEVV